MNIILFEKSELHAGTVILEDERARHVVKILRSKPGDTIKVGMIDGKAGKGEVAELSRRQPYRVMLNVSLDENINDHKPIDVMLAMPRPIMLKRIFSQATELGVGSFHIVNAKRVEKSFWDSNLIEPVNYRQHLLKGLEQAVDTRMPAVHFYKGFKPFMDKDIPALKKHYGHLLLAHPGCTAQLSEIVPEVKGRILIAVGPEGGWVEYEVERMKEAGFKGFTVGKRILRVDTAVVALHSMMSLWIDKS